MNDLQLFKNENLNLSIRAILNDDGSVSMNAEDTARGLGFIDNSKFATSGESYIRWNRINQYLKELGFPNKVGKDDFIPETVFYLLAMKANNQTAKDFQIWIAKDVLPQIRQTGSYNAPQIQESEELKQLREKKEYVKYLVELIDRYDGDTAPVDAILGLRNTNTLKTVETLRMSSDEAMNEYIKHAHMNEGDDMKYVYQNYVDYCRTHGVNPRTRQAFVLRVKELRKLTTLTKCIHGRSHRILYKF